MSRKPKSIWIILDPLDGAHLFIGEKSAWKQYKKWEEEAKDRSHDSFWEMSKPIRYDLALPNQLASTIVKGWPKWKQDVAKSLHGT